MSNFRDDYIFACTLNVSLQKTNAELRTEVDTLKEERDELVTYIGAQALGVTPEALRNMIGRL